MNMGWSRKKKDQYTCIPSAIQPVHYSAHMPIIDLPKKYEIVKDYVEEEFTRPGLSHDPDFEAEDLNEPHRLIKAEVRASGIQIAAMESTPTRRQDYRVQDS
ncbi:hypothetical protein TNCV_2860711 [Trichonephila clavipes]|nr:hypothetical protein TNCV_2860711 [Trichonephila clavipes]